MGEGNLGNQNHQKTLSGIVGTVTGIVAGAGLAAFCINNPYMPYVVAIGVGVGALVSEGNFMQRRYGKAVKNFAYAGILTGGAMVTGNYLGPDAEIDALRYFQTGDDRGVVVTVDGEQRPYLDVDGKLVLFDDARQQGSNLENKISRDKWDERLELIKNSVRSEGEVKK